MTWFDLNDPDNPAETIVVMSTSATQISGYDLWGYGECHCHGDIFVGRKQPGYFHLAAICHLRYPGGNPNADPDPDAYCNKPATNRDV